MLYQSYIINYCQGEHPVTDYSTNLIDKLAMLNIQDEAHKMQIFLQGLNPDIAASVILMKPTDLNEAEEAALLAEATQKLKKKNLWMTSSQQWTPCH